MSAGSRAASPCGRAARSRTPATPRTTHRDRRRVQTCSPSLSHEFYPRCFDTRCAIIEPQEGAVMARRIVWALGIVALLLVAAAIAWRVPAVQDRVIRAAIGAMVERRPDYLFKDDALRVLLCGTASPLAH